MKAYLFLVLEVVVLDYNCDGLYLPVAHLSKLLTDFELRKHPHRVPAVC